MGRDVYNLCNMLEAALLAFCQTFRVESELPSWIFPPFPDL